MKIRNLYKTLAFYTCVVFAFVIALGVYPKHQVNDRDSHDFSAMRVSDDIRVIAKTPHSIQHPKERKVLADYLFYRLHQMGGDTQIIEYDTIPSKIGGEFSYANIYSVFPPPAETPLPDKLSSDLSQESYLLLVAHYDSRFRQVVGKDTVFSFGAADDGYGLGVIMELVAGAMKYRDEWKQGIKVLFTDAEEHNMDGMRSAFAENKEIFDGVNFALNIEARGVKGPALLFETSGGNEKLIDLYSCARDPHGLSLTSVVYRLLPNFTDFTIIKDSIPGMNFSVIDDLHYYHTDKDNYDNISLESLQHYGSQLEPIVRKYLTGEEYSSADALKGEEDIVFFALPLLGLFKFSKPVYIALNIIVCLLFLFVLYVYVRYKIIRIRAIFKCLMHVALFAVMAFGLGLAVSYLSSLHWGMKFSIVDLRYIPYDKHISIVFFFVWVLWILVFSRLQERKDRYYMWNLLLGTNIFLLVLSLVSLVALGENFFFLVPLATSSVALFFSVAKNFKWLYLISCLIIMITGVYFFYLLYTAITLGSLGVIMFMCVIYIFSVISQYYCLKRGVL